MADHPHTIDRWDDATGELAAGCCENVYQLYATREVCDEASERGSADYMDSVMSKTPPTAKKAVGSGALVVTIAIIPPSKATTPTTAMLDRLT